MLQISSKEKKFVYQWKVNRQQLVNESETEQNEP